MESSLVTSGPGDIDLAFVRALLRNSRPEGVVADACSSCNRASLPSAARRRARLVWFGSTVSRRATTQSPPKGSSMRLEASGCHRT